MDPTMLHSRRSALRAVAGIGLLAGPAFAQDQAQNAPMQQNPALARAYAHDPAAAERILAELERIVRGDRLRGGEAEEPADPGERALLEENPLLREAWRINPKAALKQIEEIIRVGGSP
jgi:hypothetical protein